MATHSSILAWRIPWTEEPGRLQSTELQRIRHRRVLTFHPSQYNNPLVFPLVQEHKAPKYSRGNLNFQFSVGSRTLLVSWWKNSSLGAEKAEPKVAGTGSKNYFQWVIECNFTESHTHPLDSWILCFSDNPFTKSISNAKIVV